MALLELNTDRLFLRTMNLNDAEAIFAYRSDAFENRYQGWIPKKIEDVYDFINNRITTEVNVANTWHQMVVINRENKKLIGDIGIHFMDEEKKQVELGFTLDKKCQGNGFATESVKQVIEYLFNTLNKHRIIGSIDPRNSSSIKLVERLGFRKEAHFRKSIFIDGEWVDDLIYAMLSEDWITK